MKSGLIAYLDSVKSRDPAARSRWDVLFYPGTLALAFHRLAHWLWEGELHFIARLINHFALGPAPRRQDLSLLNTLTERERQVFELVAQGLSNAEIAERLFLTEGTVKTHVSHVFEKVEVRDRTQAVIFAYDVGVVRPRTG